MMKIRIEFKSADKWFGVYHKPGHIWICIIPMMPIHISWGEQSKSKYQELIEHCEIGSSMSLEMAYNEKQGGAIDRELFFKGRAAAFNNVLQKLRKL